MADKISIQVNVKRWREAELEGNYRCPHCNTVLLLFNNAGQPAYALCPECARYYVEDTGTLLRVNDGEETR